MRHLNIISLVMTLVLAACGGAGTEIASIPVPTPAPTPTPISVAVPLAASVPASPAFPQAVAGGPTIAAPGSTLFPLLQTAQVTTSTTVADTATMNAGATITLNPGAAQATLNIANGVVGAANVVLPALSYGGQSIYYAGRPDRPTYLFPHSGAGTSALSWTVFGSWNVYTSQSANTGSRYTADFVTGFQTPGAAVPTTGSATYTGGTVGQGLQVRGMASLQADFANRTINGTLTNMVVITCLDYECSDAPWNSVSLSASFAAGQSRFTGTSAVTSAPDNGLSLKAGATGTVVGSFFGPKGEEIGAVWTLSDGTGSVTGSLGAKADDR